MQVSVYLLVDDFQGSWMTGPRPDQLAGMLLLRRWIFALYMERENLVRSIGKCNIRDTKRAARRTEAIGQRQLRLSRICRILRCCGME